MCQRRTCESRRIEKKKSNRFFNILSRKALELKNTRSCGICKTGKCEKCRIAKNKRIGKII